MATQDGRPHDAIEFIRGLFKSLSKMGRKNGVTATEFRFEQ